MSLKYEYKYKYAEQEKYQRIYLDKRAPLVIRLDGKNITKNHGRINLICSGFTEYLFESCKALAAKKEYSCEIYSIMDEASLVFQEGTAFFRGFADTNQIYASNIFLQCFLSLFWQKEEYRNVQFGISLFSLYNKEDVGLYISERQRIGKIVATDYYAKDKLPQSHYHNKSSADIVSSIKHCGLYDDFIGKEQFLAGLRCRIIDGCEQMLLETETKRTAEKESRIVLPNLLEITESKKEIPWLWKKNS